jgi:hypothetical protein
VINFNLKNLGVLEAEAKCFGFFAERRARGV